MLIINFYIINLLLVNRVNVVVVVEELCVILTMSYSNDIFEPIKRDRDDCDSDQPKNQTKFFFFFFFSFFPTTTTTTSSTNQIYLFNKLN